MFRSITQIFRAAYSGLPLPVWYFALVTLVNRAGTMVLPFLTLYLTRDRGYDESIAGLAFSIYGSGALMGTWLGGRLSDRIGPLPTIYLSFFTAGFSLLAIEFLTGKLMLMTGLFFMGLFGEAYRPAGGVAIAAFCPPEKRARAYALDRLAINLGFSIGPTMGGFLAAHNYAWLFRVDGITCILAGSLMLIMPMIKPSFRLKTPVRREEIKNTMPQGESPWKDTRFVMYMFWILIANLMFYQLFTTWPLYIRNEMGLPEQQLGLLLAFNGVLIIAFEMIITHQVEGRDPLHVIGFGSFLTGLGLVVLVLGSSLWLAVLSTLLWTISEMLAAPTMSSYVANRSNEHNRGRYMGIFNSAHSLGYLLSPILGSWIYSSFGPDTLWYVCGILGVAAWIGFPGVRLVGRKKNQTDPNEGPA